MTAQAYDVHTPCDAVPDGGATVCGGCFGQGCAGCGGQGSVRARSMSETISLFDVAPNPIGLPEVVRVISMWHKWAAAVAAGVKTIETRTWPWPYPPGWLVIHASLRADGDVPGRVEPFPMVPPVEPGSFCALVWVSGCRPLVESDRDAALVYHADRFAWPLERVHLMRHHRTRGPQKFASVPRHVVYECIEAGKVPA